ncbi:Protein patched -like protein 1 [Trichinella murrelli]|uniref:Protein patched-like protein 1 n=1 Tax=Trichinella murrelli TaxID=144512 RepID=A0A0V0TNT4_9BILA|nr:Protein patched -like protein 1 [Trichinella murrelli]
MDINTDKGKTASAPVQDPESGRFTTRSISNAASIVKPATDIRLAQSVVPLPQQMGRAKLCLYDRELQRMLPAQVAPPLQPRCISRLGRLPSDMVQIDTSKWGEEFRRRPSWVDAGMALRLIQSDKAKGNKPALWIRMLLQRGMLCLGHRIQRHAGQVLFFGLLMLSICCIGLRLVAFETDMEKLWIEKGGRLEEERNFLSENSARLPNGKLRSVEHADNRDEVMVANTGDAFLILIQTPRKGKSNILTKDDLLLHEKVVSEMGRMTISLFGETWGLEDICFRPPSPSIEGAISEIIKVLLDKIIPCTLITPLDCFWDGSKPLGPNPPLKIGAEIQTFVPSLQDQVTWKNLNPQGVIDDVKTLGIFDISIFDNFLERSGIASAYQHRPCIEPLDPECPSTAPNYINMCPVVEKFLAWNLKTKQYSFPNITMDVEKLLMGNDTVDSTEPTTTTKPKETSMYEQEYNTFEEMFGSIREKPVMTEPKICRLFKEDVRSLLLANETLSRQFLPAAAFTNYSTIMTGGCRGYAENFMKWPEDLIIGGITKKDEGIEFVNLIDCFRAEALQTVFMMSSAAEVYERFASSHSESTLARVNWSIENAQSVLTAWQRNFSNLIYDYANNTAENRQVHPMSGTSINDMLEMFSELNPTVMIVGYVLMVFYASFSLCSTDDGGVASGVGLAVCGCILVTISSLAGLGCSMLLGVKFNPTTTQVVPFLSLGLGVDDMFLLLHNYRDIARQYQVDQIGMLLKETGLSALLTSVNNILAFLVGALLPIPALRSFCIQVALVLLLNAVTILTIYPALMTFDLARRKRRLLDVFCCIRAPQPKSRLNSRSEPVSVVYEKVNSGQMNKSNNSNSVSKSPVGENEPKKRRCHLTGITVENFLKYIYGPLITRTPVKIGIVVFNLVLVALSIDGVTKISLGLELTDLIPKHTAPYGFLAAREAYFSFFPFSAVLKGPMDIPHKQRLIREYRSAIGEIDYVIRHDGQPSEKYWLSMMTEWLVSLQQKFDEDWQKGYINRSGVISTLVSNDAKLAYKLLCNQGDILDCGRVGTTRLIDREGLINPDGFYNYLTAWFNLDQMSYYISQANFYPQPPIWYNTDHIRSDTDNKVPPAVCPTVSHIPFFVTNLVDTASVVDLINKVRSICEEYTAMGLPNFPEGLPFNFWEHYVHLNRNLLLALLMISASVFVIVSLLLFSPWTALLVVTVVDLMVFELAGFMGMIGLKMNPVSAVTLITAVGIGVEFTVHMSLSFLTALGSRDQRVQMAVDHMFVPVLHGGLSTLLGLIMLAFSEFEFIVHYFFLVMSCLILLGIINGLFLFPVLLSWLGPPGEVRTIDGSDSLPPPSPSLVAKQLASLSKKSNQGAYFGLARASQKGYRRQSDMSLSTITEERTPPNSATPPVLTITPVQTRYALAGNNSPAVEVTSSTVTPRIHSSLPNVTNDLTQMENGEDGRSNRFSNAFTRFGNSIRRSLGHQSQQKPV